MRSFSKNVEKFSLKKENEAMLRHEKEKIHGIVAPKLPEFHRENFLQKRRMSDGGNKNRSKREKTI
jgi:hypothetical protein